MSLAARLLELCGLLCVFHLCMLLSDSLQSSVILFLSIEIFYNILSNKSFDSVSISCLPEDGFTDTD